MNNKAVLKILEEMPEDEFQQFLVPALPCPIML